MGAQLEGLLVWPAVLLRVPLCRRTVQFDGFLYGGRHVGQ